jgi:hypothetical protein
MTKRKVEVYEIESGVPIPKDIGLPPLDQLKVDESVQFPADKLASVRTTASRLKKEEQKEFVVKKIDEDHGRVWRVK